jgi:hypothetical protein
MGQTNLKRLMSGFGSAERVSNPHYAVLVLMDNLGIEDVSENLHLDMQSRVAAISDTELAKGLCHLAATTGHALRHGCSVATPVPPPPVVDSNDSDVDSDKQEPSNNE